MKKRLDVLIFEKGLVKSRSEGLAFILTQKVKVNDKIIDKAGQQVDIDANIVIEIDESKRFVSRGGLKLDKAIKEFKIDLSNKICLDIGASTGGFTDCMLQNAAKKVYALDVGYGQLDWKLRNNEKVVNLEKINFRIWNGMELDDRIDFVSIDVSFISLKKILQNLNNLLRYKFVCVALIKPQFEVGRLKIGKNGVVRDQSARHEVVCDIKNFINDINLEVIGICESPIKGYAGNIEYLICFKKI
ncbi:MAG: TlyA family RNA methyltransferase [Elusimicrobiota bacterium]|jgi:23S rRNA (cytidine1920-2'-O)/16S rRNA (cytidine1409-2'-O)-methyltransferase|nr:TlyA family RNA methyltransferase [Elusimicrobiota bacterium]